MRLMNYNFCSQDATVITASTENTNFLAANLKHPFRSKSWRSTDVDSESVVFDLITSEDIDSVVLLWPREDGIKLSNTAVVKIQANATNVWTSPAVDQTLTINNDYVVASHYFTSDQSYRYWRVLIEDPSNPYGYLELGVVWLGKSIDIENAQNGFKFGLVDRSVTTMTAFGHPYTDEYPMIESVEFDYKLLDYTAIQTLENAFRINGSKIPVLVVLDAEGTLFNKDHFGVYGLFKNSFTLQHLIRDILNTDGISVVGIS